MKTTLIITTYNWKEALKAVLESVKRQTALPDEVIVADDGSRDDTKAMLDQLLTTFPGPCCVIVNSRRIGAKIQNKILL